MEAFCGLFRVAGTLYFIVVEAEMDISIKPQLSAWINTAGDENFCSSVI